MQWRANVRPDPRGAHPPAGHRDVNGTNGVPQAPERKRPAIADHRTPARSGHGPSRTRHGRRRAAAPEVHAGVQGDEEAAPAAVSDRAAPETEQCELFAEDDTVLLLGDKPDEDIGMQL